MNLELFPRIALYNANPITLLGRGIQCIYEGSLAWLAIATHPLFAGDYYIDDDEYPSLFPEYLPAPSLYTPFEQKMVTPPAAVSTTTTLQPTFEPPVYVAPTPYMVPEAPISTASLAATETNIATLTSTTPNVAGPPEQDNSNPYYEAEHHETAFLQHWRSSATKESNPVPVIERPTTVNISTPSSPPVLSVHPSDDSTLPPYSEDEAQTPNDDSNIPGLLSGRTPEPELTKHYLSPPGSPTSFRERRKRLRFVNFAEPEPEPRKRTKRHSYRERTPEQPDEDPVAEEPTVRYRSEHFTPYRSHHHREHGRRRRSRRKDRVYDRAEAEAEAEAYTYPEVPFERHDESFPPYHPAYPPSPHPRNIELPYQEHDERYYHILRHEDETHDRREILEHLEAHSPDRRYESPLLEPLSRPPTPYPRRELPSPDFHAEADEFLNRMEEQLYRAENTLRELRREKRYSTQDEHDTHDTRRDRREHRRRKKERRSAPYESRSIATSTSAYEYSDPYSEDRRSRTRDRRTRGRRRQRSEDDLTFGLESLLLAQPQPTRANTSAHLLESSAELRSPRLSSVVRPEPSVPQRAGPGEGALQLDSLLAALPAVQQHQDDADLSVLLQGVQLNVGVESNVYQNQQSGDVDHLGITPEHERPLTIRIPSVEQLQARIIARNATVVATPPTPPTIE